MAPDSKPRIVIIGAGMAGLTAARKLHATAPGRFRLSLLEAGDRIGGRILTSEFAGARVEMGATWIQGITNSPLHAIAGEVGALDPDDSVPYERMDGLPRDPVTVDLNGGAPVDPSLVRRVSSLYFSLMDDARSGRATRENGRGVGSYLRSACGDLTGEEKAVFAVYEGKERTFTAADDLDDLDLTGEEEYKDFPGDQITIAKGYSRVIESLAADLPAGAIQLRRRVHRIEWGTTGSDGCVTIHLEDGSTVPAEHVIVTVSLGVLKAGLVEGGTHSGLVFSPPLPPFKEESIRRLGFGAVNKLFIELDGGEEGKKFPFLQLAMGPAEGEHVARIPRWMRRTESICPIYGGSRVLLAWVAGKEAVELEKVDEEEVIRGVHATLEEFLGGKLDPRSNGSGGLGDYGRVVGVKRSGWAGNPLFLGSYSYVAVGSSADDQDRLAEPLPRGGVESEGSSPLQVLFAGEATQRTYYSTTHGAYLSGVREADRILQYYSAN